MTAQEQKPKTSGLHYKGNEGSLSVYEYFTGGRPVFEAFVDNNDPKLHIYVGLLGAAWAHTHEISCGAADSVHKTEGHAAWTTEGGVTHISGYSVSRYINRRAFAILANLFVPKNPVISENF